MKKADLPAEPSIKLAIFDFGGVVAEEGFRQGLMAIARENSLDPERFYLKVSDVMHLEGYVTGCCSENSFWASVRSSCGITGTDASLRAQILSRFTIRRWMLDLVAYLKNRSIVTALLSDQTNWLDELNERNCFFRCFDRVFNSFHLHKSKHDPTVFDDVLLVMGTQPSETLFVDDSPSHLERARSRGIKTILYSDRADFCSNLRRYGIYYSSG